MTRNLYEEAWKKLERHLKKASGEMTDGSTEKLIVTQTLFVMSILEPETSSEGDE
jgi:hypothetical protein